MKQFFSVVFWAIWILWTGPIALGSERAEKHEEATQAFKELHFFSEGRGMHMVPGLIELYRKGSKRNENGFAKKFFEDRWGLNLIDREVVGLFDVPYKEHRIGVLGCVVCHSGKAAGRFYIGLGNKNIDVYRLGKDAHFIEKLYTTLNPFQKRDHEYKKLKRSALSFAKYLSNKKIGNLSQGLVPVGFIRGWFYRVLGMKVPGDLSRGQVKVPALWGYGIKRPEGQFSDGFGNGILPGWAIAVELAAGQTVDAVRSYLPRVERAEELLGEFLPPAYPFGIDRDLADRGRVIFNNTCANCHGTYEKDSSGHPIFKAPKYIAWEVVRTDRDRIKGNTKEFRQMVAINPLNDVLQATEKGDGYFAPRLEGIWARFPYLHNGSVPNLRALLTKPSQRPHVFSLKKAGERENFTEKDLGLVVRKASTRKRSTYVTSRIGHSNRGHDFYTFWPNRWKNAVIEYLKTL